MSRTTVLRQCIVTDMREDYYEDDEPVAAVIAAFAKGEKGKTTPPPRGVTTYLAVAGYKGLQPGTANRPNGELVHRH